MPLLARIGPVSGQHGVSAGSWLASYLPKDRPYYLARGWHADYRRARFTCLCTNKIYMTPMPLHGLDWRNWPSEQLLYLFDDAAEMLVESLMATIVIDDICNKCPGSISSKTSSSQ